MRALTLPAPSPPLANNTHPLLHVATTQPAKAYSPWSSFPVRDRNPSCVSTLQHTGQPETNKCFFPVNLRLKSIIDPYYSRSQATSGKVLVEVLASEDYSNIDPHDYHRLLQCFCLSISSLTHGFPADPNLEKFIYTTAAVFSDPEQDETILQALLQVITAGYRKLQGDIATSWSTEQELHGTLFRHLYVTVKRLERILTQYNETRGEGHSRDITLGQSQTNLHPVTV